MPAKRGLPRPDCILGVCTATPSVFFNDAGTTETGDLTDAGSFEASAGDAGTLTTPPTELDAGPPINYNDIDNDGIPNDQDDDDDNSSRE